MDGHLCVVDRTSTCTAGKPGATRYYWDPPDSIRWTRLQTSTTADRMLASVARKKNTQKLQRARKRYLSLLLRAGDVHPNPGPTLRIAQFNILGSTEPHKFCLSHKADIILLQELHITEADASQLSLPGFRCFALGRNAKGGGVAVLVRERWACEFHSKVETPAVNSITVCVKVDRKITLSQLIFHLGRKMSAQSVQMLSQLNSTAHVIGADTNCHHEAWDTDAAPNPAGAHIINF